jgi:tripartite-type tricarboxylate transporter receptor subunit TctC
VSCAVVADEVEDFYTGKQVSLYIGYSAGGGYDTYARVLARHIGKHIPGNPTVVPQNMPGAGSLTLANWLYNIAPKDGTVFGTIGRGLAMEPLLGGRGTRFNAAEYSWIGSLNNEVSMCVSWHTSNVKTVDDLRTRQLIVGGTGSGSDTDKFPTVMRNLLGLNIRLISGYPGGNDVERGRPRCGGEPSARHAGGAGPAGRAFARRGGRAGGSG